MKSLAKKFLDHELTRREFALGVTALGFSGAAAESVVAAVAEPEEGQVTSGVPFTGTAARYWQNV